MLFRLFNVLLLLIVSSIYTMPSLANTEALLKDQDQPEENRFLPVHEAFSVAAELEDQYAYIYFSVAPDHYLYKERIRFTPTKSVPSIGQPLYPEAISKFDPNFNRTLPIFPESFTVKLPISVSDEPAQIDVSFQGCAEAGLCYPPHKITLSLTSDQPATTRSSLYNSTNYNDQGYFERLLGNANFVLVIFLFILAGIGLSFTPCVLPMIPIMSSMILGSDTQKRSRTMTLTMTYIVSMSFTLAVAGTLAGTFGASLNLQAKLQSPWLIIPLAVLFLVLALSMFGLFEIQLPEALRSKTHAVPKKQGRISSAMLLGALSALAVSPCVSAPLAGALLYISTTGNAFLGGVSLFALGLGMGAPLLAIGIFGRQLLPKAGQWMQTVRKFFAILLLAVAIWMLDRIIPSHITLALWGTLAILSALTLGTFSFKPLHFKNLLKQSLGLVLLTYGVLLLYGFTQGNENPFKPLASSQESYQADNQSLYFRKANSLDELNAAFEQALASEKPIIIDIYADWCISCHSLEKNLLSSPETRPMLENVALIKFDITKNQPEHHNFMNKHQLFGPPALLFFNQTGLEQPHLKLAGDTALPILKDRLEQLVSSH
ncbi:protein-disulfide reductase DsbD [Endozoicomonas sp. Mp262]|uniref:protein-disulfide reductase DsbD n=1 Tax=Endozoicomonas sp. Mp262 TaxID=2919499 RepID=UPI0021DB34C2